jgi:hypothetical protein
MSLLTTDTAEMTAEERAAWEQYERDQAELRSLALAEVTARRFPAEYADVAAAVAHGELVDAAEVGRVPAADREWLVAYAVEAVERTMAVLVFHPDRWPLLLRGQVTR